MMRNAVHRALALTLLCVVMLSQYGCQKEEGGEMGSGAPPADVEAWWSYYARHGVMTEPGQYAQLYEGLPAEPSELCKVGHGLILHVFHAHRYGVELPEEKMQEVRLRTVEQMLGRITELDDSPLTSRRPPERRLVGNCRDFSVLLASMLQHHGIPARARCGFATYFTPDTYEDHWICEYRSVQEDRWVRIDPQLDDIIKDACAIDFDPLDLPDGSFLPAGQVWVLCRKGEIDPDHCGIMDLKGLWFVKDNLLRDLMALNKVELMPWDCTEFMEQSKDPSDEEYALLDDIARLIATGDDAFAQIISTYESDSRFHMPADWAP